MTFYWWSHWFWITVISNLIIFPLNAVVLAYPSQDSSQEYNQHQTETTRKLVTRLYQSSTTWVTEASIVARTTTTAEKTILQSVAMSEPNVNAAEDAAAPPHPPSTIEDVTNGPITKQQDGFEEYYYDHREETETEQIDLEDVEEDMENVEHQPSVIAAADDQENDIKRSAEHFSKSSETESKIMELNPMESTPTSSSTEEHKNNYTNFTNTLTSSTNATTSVSSNVTSITTTTADHMSASATAAEASLFASTSPVVATLTSLSNATALPHAPATPKIVRTHNPLEWLSSIADIAASPPPAPVTTDVNDDKFPFTLENVHKTEDLIREESEPRTRKSKGLSAEYKHGYINYSSESKNLLTRSASTTVNEYESEENNISSEALSVQRAYMMDVGAISAICFTVFGICCTVGTIGIVLYRRRFLNKPQALSEPDSSVYIDDSTMRVSDNSDEMYSLDNDSFLNSLEAMTIQNYWTDTVKHTKL